MPETDDLLAGIVLADHGTEITGRAHGHDVSNHVAGTAECVRLALDVDDRHRRLR